MRIVSTCIINYILEGNSKKLLKLQAQDCPDSKPTLLLADQHFLSRNCEAFHNLFMQGLDISPLSNLFVQEFQVFLQTLWVELDKGFDRTTREIVSRCAE